MTGIRLDQPTRTALFGATKLLKERGLPDLARFALQRLQPGRQAAPVVVVVGEVKRGKSSLVNALLGTPGLSPVGVDVATDCFLRFTPPQEELPAGTARVVLAGGSETIPTAEIAAWAAVGGTHTEPRGDEPLVRGVEVGVDARWAPGLELVDTPGLGGLRGAHADIARDSADWASLLVFVSDCGQPLTAGELGYLAGLSAHVDGVVLVMTKKDLYPAGWREVAAENRRLLRAHAPRFAEVDIVVVSSTLAATAARVGEPATAEALLAASGIPELGALLSARAGDADRTAAANALRTVRTGLDQVTAQLELRRRAAAGSAELLGDLRAERARLEHLADQQSRWNLDLDRDMGTVRAQAIAMAQREFGAVRDRWTALIATDRRAMLAGGRRQLMAEISAELEAAAGRVAAAFYRALYAMVHQLFADVAAADTVFRAVSPELGRLQPAPRPLRPSGVSRLDPSLVTTAFFGVSMAKGMFGAAAGASLLSPLILPLAGGWLAVNVTYRVVKGGRTQLQTWLAESVQAVQAEVVTTTDNVIRDFRPEIVVGFREFLAAATAAVRSSLREAEAAATADRREREQRTAAVDRHLAVVEAQRQEVDRALAAVLTRPPRQIPAGAGTSGAAAASHDPTTGPPGTRAAGERP
ncbi:dynamin family protein [Nakamurella deserti]|uniref:dynamin family protein n=1 Tax=Nakamurella deserti TaxID=2164074 RepID=UPI000DBE11C7|nr:dynamin family protein [Nakamurella deserti]